MNKKHWCISRYVCLLARFDCLWSTLCYRWDDYELLSCSVLGLVDLTPLAKLKDAALYVYYKSL